MLVFKVRRLKANFASVCLKSYEALCGVWILHSSGRSSKFWATSGCRMPRQWWGLWQDCVSASATYIDAVFFFLICQMCSCHSAALRFLRGNCSMCSCGLGMSMGVGEFRIFLYYHLEPEVLFGFVHLNSTLVFRNKLCFKVGDSLYFLSSF